MARESDFINKLSDFTKTLEDLVDILKEQQKIGPTEVVNKLLENIDADKLSTIADNIETVKNNTIEINKNVEKTLKVVQELKREKEGGLPAEISSKENKTKVLDGIKTIILIAGGVLAIGLAFKIIGNVDFLSVVALSFGIMMAAEAFSKVASMTDDKGKPLAWKQIIMGAATLVIMSGAILISGLILKGMPTIGLGELLTIVFVGASMGLASYFLLSAIGKVKMKDLLMAPLVALVLPAIALAIVGAAYILQYTPTIGFKQLVSALMVSVALLPLIWGFQFIIKGMRGVKPEEVLMAVGVIPLIAIAIVASSWILMGVADLDLIKVLKAGLGVGIAILAMVPTIWLLNKAGLLKPTALKDLAIGALAIPLIATAITLSSWVLSIGNYTNAPDLEWTLSVGLAIMIFAVPVAALGALMMGSGGVGYAALAAGILAVPLIALAMVAVSYILPLGNYSSYPPLEWTASVGLAMLLFAVPVIALGILIMTGIGLPALILGIVGVGLIAQAVVFASHILPKGTYGKYPSLEWSAGVGLAMLLFTPSVLALGVLIMTGIGLPALIMGIVGIGLIAQAVVFASHILPDGTYSLYPSLEWSAGAGLAMLLFGVPTLALGIMILSGIGLPALLLGIIGIGLIAQAVVFASHILPNGTYSLYPPVEWTAGVGLAMLTFGIPVMTLGAYMLSGIGFAALVMGIIGVSLIAASVVAASYILSTGNYKSFPSLAWASGVGLSLTAFGLPAIYLGTYILSTLGVGIEIIAAGLGVILLIASTISAVSYLLKGNYTSYPSLDWAEGVSKSLNAFSNINVNISFDLFKILNLVGIMYIVASMFDKMQSLNLPSSEWTDNFIRLVGDSTMKMSQVGISLMSIGDFDGAMWRILSIGHTMLLFAGQMFIIQSLFGNVFKNGGIMDNIANSLERIINVLPTKDKIDPIWSLIDALNALSSVSWKDLLDITILSSIIGTLSNQIDKINSEKVDSLAKLGVGLQIISLVNEEKLKSVLDTIKDKINNVNKIVDDGGFIQNIFKGIYEQPSEHRSVEIDNVQSKQKSSPKDDYQEKFLNHLSNIDVNTAKLANLTQDEKEERLKPKDADGNEKTFAWS